MSANTTAHASRKPSRPDAPARSNNVSGSSMLGRVVRAVGACTGISEGDTAAQSAPKGPILPAWPPRRERPKPAALMRRVCGGDVLQRKIDGENDLGVGEPRNPKGSAHHPHQLAGGP